MDIVNRFSFVKFVAYRFDSVIIVPIMNRQNVTWKSQMQFW
jgi:hypothetical protein